MALNCPNCGVEIPTANINIQKTLALCADCGHVFDFGDSVPARKAKQRKVRQPERLLVREEEHRLELAYTRVFDLNEKIGLGVLSFLSVFLVFIAIMAARDGAPLLIPPLFVTIAAVFGYVALMSLVNTTRIIVDEETLAVQSGPLKFPINANKTVNLDEVAEVFCEETETSKSRAALDRYYRVCARFADGNRVALVKSLPEDYAFYITQALEECLPPTDAAALVAPGDEFYGEDAHVNDTAAASQRSD